MKFTVLKKVLVKLLELFGAPIMIRRPGNFAPFPPRRYDPGLQGMASEQSRIFFTLMELYIKRY